VQIYANSNFLQIPFSVAAVIFKLAKACEK